MHRDMKKLIDRYERSFGNGTNTKERYYFTVSEYRQVHDLGSQDPFSLIDRALCAGFVAGYRAAQMDAKDQGKKPPHAPRTKPFGYGREYCSEEGKQ